MENLTMKFKEILRILRRFDETYKMCNQWENVLAYANKININPRHDENGIKRNYLNLSRTVESQVLLTDRAIQDSAPRPSANRTRCSKMFNWKA